MTNIQLMLDISLSAMKIIGIIDIGIVVIAGVYYLHKKYKKK